MPPACHPIGAGQIAPLANAPAVAPFSLDSRRGKFRNDLARFTFLPGGSDEGGLFSPRNLE